MRRRQFSALVAASWATGLAPHAAQAQAFPTRSITWVVPFTPGGVTDTTSRAVAKKMSELLGIEIDRHQRVSWFRGKRDGLGAASRLR